MILYDIKILAEKKFKEKLEARTNLTRQYEEFRFSLRDNYDQIAAEGYCERCKGNQTVALHYLDLKTLSLAEEKRDDCPNCNTKHSLIIIHF